MDFLRALGGSTIVSSFLSSLWPALSAVGTAVTAIYVYKTWKTYDKLRKIGERQNEINSTIKNEQVRGRLSSFAPVMIFRFISEPIAVANGFRRETKLVNAGKGLALGVEMKLGENTRYPDYFPAPRDFAQGQEHPTVHWLEVTGNSFGEATVTIEYRDVFGHRYVSEYRGSSLLWHSEVGLVHGMGVSEAPEAS